MEFIKKGKRHNGSTVFIYKCLKCGREFNAQSKKPPICKCDWIGKQINEVTVQDVLNNNTLVCFCNSCKETFQATISKFKRFTHCHLCGVRRAEFKKYTNKRYGALKIMCKNGTAFNCKCDCGNICRKSLYILEKDTKIGDVDELKCCGKCHEGNDKNIKIYKDIYTYLCQDYKVKFNINQFYEYVFSCIEESNSIKFEFSKITALKNSAFTLEDLKELILK